MGLFLDKSLKNKRKLRILERCTEEGSRIAPIFNSNRLTTTGSLRETSFHGRRSYEPTHKARRPTPKNRFMKFHEMIQRATVLNNRVAE
jgi:hypothetical protein